MSPQIHTSLIMVATYFALIYHVFCPVQSVRAAGPQAEARGPRDPQRRRPGLPHHRQHACSKPTGRPLERPQRPGCIIIGHAVGPGRRNGSSQGRPAAVAVGSHPPGRAPAGEQHTPFYTYQYDTRADYCK
eukprot:scaffold386514_cov45-Prasinocladus_malaysianus.AAC.1